MVESEGVLSESLQASAGATYDFGDVELVGGGLRFLDVDLGTNATGQLQTFGVLLDGSLVVRTLVGSTWSAWSVIRGSAQPKLLSIATGSIAGQAPFLFGIGDYNLPYYSVNAGASWSLRL